jgi:hypothetical protein
MLEKFRELPQRLMYLLLNHFWGVSIGTGEKLLIHTCDFGLGYIAKKAILAMISRDCWCGVVSVRSYNAGCC